MWTTSSRAFVRVMQRAPEKQTGEDGLPIPPYAHLQHRQSDQPENLLDFVQILSGGTGARGRAARPTMTLPRTSELVPMQPGDVPVTYADTSALERDTGFKPSTPLREGLRRFAVWYKDFYRV